MNINKKYIIVFGTLILLLVFITGAITYYNEKKEQAQLPIQTPDMNQNIFSFSQGYPVTLSEFSDFIDFCKNAVFSDTEELKNREIKEIVCTIEQKTRKFMLDTTREIFLVDTYIPSFSSLYSINSFEHNQYIGISVDAKDVVRRYNPSFLEKDKLYFCSISSPSLTDSIVLQLIPNKILTFNEGNISCIGIKMNDTPSMIFPGFVPDAESLSIRQYLVDEQIASNVMNKQSFSEIKDILDGYPIVWQMEKPITP